MQTCHMMINQRIQLTLTEHVIKPMMRGGATTLRGTIQRGV